ncbi:MAG: helix-turn-helix domain-containing protein [Candidatus Eremiobacter antarcticus]|nr:helix-turn-helix transcriptional regulator [Candidatus Eremiobacteraeota bacterium]MBC5808830.1 helix-turn-helix transcriptional regulator [Candidatus Eremiobacteraeota bacterium]
METLKQRLKRLMKDAQIKDLAIAAGVSRSPIDNVLNGTSKGFKFSDGVKIALALGVQPEYLALGIQAKRSNKRRKRPT